MARLFTISFLYNEETYNSMVTVKTTPYYKEYTLHLESSSELMLHLPGNKIISASPKKLFFPNATDRHSTTLMNNIINAVSVHLQVVGPLRADGNES